MGITNDTHKASEGAATTDASLKLEAFDFRLHSTARSLFAAWTFHPPSRREDDKGTPSFDSDTSVHDSIIE